eukprot:5146996-Amphidinium_carterae.1
MPREVPLATEALPMGEDSQTATLSMDCLQEDLSSSDDDFSWASLEQTNCLQSSNAHGFHTELEKWTFYLTAANHFAELERDVASHAASHPNWISRAKLTTGRRRARRVGSGGSRSSLRTVEEEEACDAFLERTHVVEPEPDDFDRHVLDRRITFTRTLRSVSDQLFARGSCTTSCCDAWGTDAGNMSLSEPRLVVLL